MRRGSYSNVMSTVAVMIALGGTAYATHKITGAEVKNGSLTGVDVQNNSLTRKDVRAITGGDVKDGSLRPHDFREGELPRGERGPEGDQGPEGPQGPQGAQGVPGPTASAAAKASTVSLTTGLQTVASAQITTTFSGRIFATATLRVGGDGGNNDVVRCRLDMLPGTTISDDARSAIPEATGSTPDENRVELAVAGASASVGAGTYTVQVNCDEVYGDSAAQVEQGDLIVWAVAA